MRQALNPSLDDVRLECVLMQAWKKASSYLPTHTWYADTLGLDYQSGTVDGDEPEEGDSE
jgi:hypothetical protein